MDLIEHRVLSLDFGRNCVTYEDRTVPTGTLACSALNIPDEIIKTLDPLCTPLGLYATLIVAGQAQTAHMLDARRCALQIINLLRDIPPFDFFSASHSEERLTKLLSDDYYQDVAEYAKLSDEEKLISLINNTFQKTNHLLRILPFVSQLGTTLAKFKKDMLPFVEELQNGGRKPSDYAASFGKFFSDNPSLSENDPGWMSVTNTSIQYIALEKGDKNSPLLAKRMHYASFVGMLRADLFEGLYAGHAPKKCPVCGRWFLTLNARLTKYCGGLAPEDKYRRTCRQIGNLQGREQRERADDHPLKKIYERRTNTINQKVGRGTLDKETAAVMKRLAKDKLERAISDHSYATDPYEFEMEQDALLAEAQRHLHQQESRW